MSSSLLHPIVGHENSARLAGLLSTLPDSAMATSNLERLVASPVFREKLPLLLADDARRLEDLLLLLSTSQFLADTLILDPESLEALIAPVGRVPSTSELTARLKALTDVATNDAALLQAFRLFRRREALRIGINDVLRDRPLEEITRDLSRVADACLEVACQKALAQLASRFGTPATRFSVLAFGKLGGDELNYSSDLDLLFVYGHDGEMQGRSQLSHADFFAKAIAEILRLVSSHTDRGIAYRIDLRLRPEGSQGPLARSLASTLSYYDVMGRTWERQALIKLRHVAGDPALGDEFLKSIEPFVYRKYFSFSEINEVKALKRQMETRAARSGISERDVKNGRGGIRDIEYTVQFLQLLNGGDLPTVRQRNTLLALEALEIAGCLTGNEAHILADAYRFLRKTEHRLQLLFDFQTHSLPSGEVELRKLAKRMGYPLPSLTTAGRLVSQDALARQWRSRLDEIPQTKPHRDDPLEQFLGDLGGKTSLDRSILDHLLHQSFTGEAAAEPESDLMLDPQPDELTIREVLSKYRFHNLNRAFDHLSRLARESVGFLSHRRCRHFLASIAPQLLRAVSETPDPDEALANLDTVTASLGAKAVLYEAFSVHPPSLKLYVDLCAGSPFLSALLTTNPGMIDELLDTLVLDQPRSREDLQLELTELLHGAIDPAPILHSFQDKELLRIGVRDLLGKSPVRATTAALSDLAETLLEEVLNLNRSGSEKRHLAVVALGKLGGRELNYHSDLDLLVISSEDADRNNLTAMVQQTIRMLTQSGPLGRLYAVDMRLRPFGKSGSLVTTLSEFRRYFAENGEAQLWERQALGRARVICGEQEFAGVVERELRAAIVAKPWQSEFVAEIRRMRDRLQQSAAPGDLKRSAGGLVDVEFLVQLLQLKYGRLEREILVPNVLDALAAMKTARLLRPGEAAALESRYTFLRAVETRLRIVSDRSLKEIPNAPEDREKLARRLGFEAKDGVNAGERFQMQFQRLTADVRTLFDTITLRER